MASVDLLFGPMLIGVFLNTMLYGALVVQMFIYYQTYKRDATWIRYFVLYLLICETMNTGFDIGMMYEPLVVRYATPRATIRAPIMLSADPIMTVFISTPVQLFIAWRIKVISGSKLLTGIICFFACCSMVGGIATTVSVTLIPQYARLQKFDGAVITWLASSAVADICITASLVWSLHKRRTGVSVTDDVINRIIRLTLQTGAITALSATADVVIFVAIPHTTLNFIWDFALSKLYTNSLMSTLNARAGWNHLNDAHGRDNVLFGDTTAPSRLSSSLRTPKMISMDSYELRSGFVGAPGQTPVAKDGRDLESGITITKVVERLEDPIPGV